MNVLIPHIRETIRRLLPINFVYCSIITHLSNDQIFSLIHSSSLTCGHVPLQLMTDSLSLVADLLNRATSVGSSHVSGFILHLELSIQPLHKQSLLCICTCFFSPFIMRGFQIPQILRCSSSIINLIKNY